MCVCVRGRERADNLFAVLEELSGGHDEEDGDHVGNLGIDVLGEQAGNQEMLGQGRPPSFSRPW